MAMKFIITGSDRGKPKLIGSHQFDANGEYHYAGDPAAIGSLLKYFATFNTYLVGSNEYEVACARDKELFGYGQSKTAEGGRKVGSDIPPGTNGNGTGGSAGSASPASPQIESGAQGSGAESGRVAFPKSDDPEVNNLQDAIAALDSATDDHWNEEGLPRINAVEELAKVAGLTRKQIEVAAPGYNRDAAMKNGLADI